MKHENKRAPRHIPDPKKVTLPPTDYQPSKAEFEEEIDIPSMSVKRMHEAFFRPFQFVREK